MTKLTDNSLIEDTKIPAEELVEELVEDLIEDRDISELDTDEEITNYATTVESNDDDAEVASSPETEETVKPSDRRKSDSRRKVRVVSQMATRPGYI